MLSRASLPAVFKGSVLPDFCIIIFLADQRQLAGSMRGIGIQVQDMPEWKKHITGGSKASYGKKEKRSLLEQRQGLPIFKLKDELLKVRPKPTSTQK